MSEFAIRVVGLSKAYQMYARPSDRLRQFIWPRLRQLFGLPTQQYYRDFWALKDVSFSVKRGETVGIIGRNGSGKSTLLQMICGTLTPTQGEVQVHGRVAALLELGSGFNPEFTGRENVYLNAIVLGLTHQQVNERFEAIAKFADIGEFIDQPVKTYSSGMLVRLAFAVIAHVDADILVIDEALAVGDTFFTQKCMRFIRAFRQTGTILFVSHDDGAVRNLCGQALWLSKGTQLAFNSAKTVCDSYLASYYDNEEVAGLESAAQAEAETLAQTSDLTTEVKIAAEASGWQPAVDPFSRISSTDGLESSASFGHRGGEILKVELLSAIEGSSMARIQGHEEVVLRVTFVAHQGIKSPIVGFYFKDRLGQQLFGDNTFLSTQSSSGELMSGEQGIAEFSFRMPLLPSGDYSVTVALAEGSQEEHIQHHWVHDALVVKSVSLSVCTGLIGIPMREIKLLLPATRPHQ